MTTVEHGVLTLQEMGEGRGKVSIDKNWMTGYDTIPFMNNKVYIYICVCVCVYVWVCVFIHNSNTCLYKGRGMAWGFPGGTSGKELPCQCRRYKRQGVVQSLGHEDLEEGMATHSSILAWRAPWIEEPGRLQSMWSQRPGHD